MFCTSISSIASGFERAGYFERGGEAHRFLRDDRVAHLTRFQSIDQHSVQKSYIQYVAACLSLAIDSTVLCMMFQNFIFSAYLLREVSKCSVSLDRISS